MKDILSRLALQLDALSAEDKLRSLPTSRGAIDFASNDYLGMARLDSKTHALQRGAGGSRLISGNHPAFAAVESKIATAQGVEAALIFPSGYMANLGVLSALPQKGDVVLYDELCHASIRDGLRINNAKAFKFKHNNLSDLSKRITQHKDEARSLFVVTESVFSMDGDRAPLSEMAQLTQANKAGLIVDEAHGFGVYGKGLVHTLGLSNEVLATVVTCSKAMGLHGGIVLGSTTLVHYLVNTCRSFIYTTALPPAQVEEIGEVYDTIVHSAALQSTLNERVQYYRSLLSEEVRQWSLPSDGPIQSVVVPGNAAAVALEAYLKGCGFHVKAIRHPTVPEGTERVRIILHSFNTEEEIRAITKALNEYFA